MVFRRDLLSALFSLLFVNDFDDGLTSKIYEFADGAKIAIKVIRALDKELLQRDLDKLSNWIRDWQMKFDVQKRSHVHRYQ